MLIAAEGGKPLIDARIEVDIDGVDTCAITFYVQAEIPMGLTASGVSGIYDARTNESSGCRFCLQPPLNLIVHQVAPAVTAGCPVIVKPADDTPLSCQKFVEILSEGWFAEWLGLVPCCEIPLAEKLVTDPKLSF